MTLGEKLKPYTLVLASGSPRRQELLQQMGLDFKIRLKPVEESYPKHLKSYEIANYLSSHKAKVYINELGKHELLITADTIVWLENEVLEKPGSPQEATTMLKVLSGKSHQVITSISLTTLKKQETFHTTTEVTFAEIRDQDIANYVDSFIPFDKAGGYGIQEWIGLIGVTEIKGSYTNVVGLPTQTLYEKLHTLDLS